MKNKQISLILILSLFLLFPNSSGAKLSKLGTVTMSMVTGTAFMNDSSQTWTGYTSIAGQPKQFKILAVDTTGKVATGWIGMLGTGETYIELLSDNGFDNSNSWSKGTGWSVSEGIGIAITSSSGIVQNVTLNSGVLTKYSFDLVSRTAGGCGPRYYAYDISGGYITGFTTTGTKTAYRTSSGNNTAIGIDAIGFSGTIDNFSVKQVLTPTTNGVWIHPSKTSATTGWESMQTGFNANSIASYETISTSVVPGKTHYAYPDNQTGLVGKWSLSSGSKVGSDYSGRGGDDLLTPIASPTAADGFDGETNGALSFNGSSQYLTQKVYYNQSNDDAELTGVLTDGSATATINDSDSMGITYDRRGGSSPYMIVATDSGTAVAWGYMGVNTFSTPSNTFQIYTTKTGTTQNWNKPTGTFSFANTPITYQIRKTDFQITGALTVGAWVKGAAQANVIIGKYRSTEDNKSWLILANDNKMRVYLSSDGGSSNIKSYISSIIVLDNNYHFASFTYDGNNNLKLYIDGVLDNNPTKSTDASITTLFDTRVGITLGAANNTPISSFFAGSIDEPFVYDRALSATEISNLYRAQWKTKITQIYNIDPPSYFASLPGIKDGDFKKWFAESIEADEYVNTILPYVLNVYGQLSQDIRNRFIPIGNVYMKSLEN